MLVLSATGRHAALNLFSATLIGGTFFIEL
jgi:hypothetical protein